MAENNTLSRVARKINLMDANITDMRIQLEDERLSENARDDLKAKLEGLHLDRLMEIRNVGLLVLASAPERDERDELLEMLRSVDLSNQCTAMSLMAGERGGLSLGPGAKSLMNLLQEGVKMEELKAIKTLGTEIGTGISVSLLEIMYLMNLKGKAISETKVIPDPRFKHFRDSIPELVASLKWLRSDKDAIVFNKLVALLNLADQQLAGLLLHCENDKIFWIVSQEGMGECLNKLIYLMLEMESVFGIPVLLGGNSLDSTKAKLPDLEHELKRLKKEVDSVAVHMKNYKVHLLDSKEILGMNRFLAFMNGKIWVIWNDLEGLRERKAEEAAGGLTSRELKRTDAEAEGTEHHCFVGAREYLENCRQTFCAEFGEIIGEVFASKNPDVNQVGQLLHHTFSAALSFSGFFVRKKKYLDQLFESRDIKKPDAFFAEMTEMMVGPPRLKEVLTLKQNLKGIQMCKQASFMKILKEAKEGQSVYVSQGGATELARTIYDLEGQAALLGKRISHCFAVMLVMMTLEGEESLVKLFKRYQSILSVVFNVLDQATQCVGVVLSKVNHVLTKGDEDLQKILRKRKMKNIFVTTEWFPSILKQHIDETLDDLIQVSTRMDLMFTLPLLPEVPQMSTFHWIFEELKEMEKTISKVESFIKEMQKVFYKNHQLKDTASSKEFMTTHVKPLLAELWKGGGQSDEYRLL
ncbi:hypothetical protein M0R45_013730 [Rubus argutus]|uniref:Uncharacterized protein n=1 Tax=Rubus argutus TaxID=59490 RepID=A0AAW1XKH7_RUBAR